MKVKVLFAFLLVVFVLSCFGCASANPYYEPTKSSIFGVLCVLLILASVCGIILVIFKGYTWYLEKKAQEVTEEVTDPV